ncbi:MAG TPA: hypothetical protein VNG51_01715 [Ktedonobacteraceae bacterium]|nr:hypothetical protein [Ktedonobacteraceae bacterium]
MNDTNTKMETKEMSPQARRCYISAPLNTDLKALEKLLRERQIEPILSADLSSEAITLLGEIVNVIATADLFVAILHEVQKNANVYLELGIALGVGCRILLIAPPDKPLMVDIAELPAVRTDITNYEAIGLMLDQVLLSPPRKLTAQPRIPVSQKGQPIGDFADELQKQLSAFSDRGREVEMVQLVREILEKSGYSPITTNPLLESDKRADIVVWSEEFGPWIGNPLLIEVKKVVGRKDWKGIVDQVLNYLQVSQTRSALILYAKTADTPEISPSISPPNIFFLDIQQLLTAMRTKSFAKVMIDLRNHRVHGKDTL